MGEIIVFDIACLDRDFVIKLLDKSDPAQVEAAMDVAYDLWCNDHESVGDMGCEEYISHCLKQQGYEFKVLQG